jgi:hypothetical protein
MRLTSGLQHGMSLVLCQQYHAACYTLTLTLMLRLPSGLQQGDTRSSIVSWMPHVCDLRADSINLPEVR